MLIVPYNDIIDAVVDGDSKYNVWIAPDVEVLHTAGMRYCQLTVVKLSYQLARFLLPKSEEYNCFRHELAKALTGAMEHGYVKEIMKKYLHRRLVPKSVQYFKRNGNRNHCPFSHFGA